MNRDFGTTKKGQETKLYLLKNAKGMEVGISDYGAAVVSVKVPDSTGQMQDVVLGYDDAAGYEAGDKFFGAVVGRVANRIGDASFALNGKEYKLAANDHENTLHSGPNFFHVRLWQVQESDDSHIMLTLQSPEGDQGYPGEAEITVTYTLTRDNELQIHYRAVSSADTLMNLTNHSYFNLAGQASGSVLDQVVQIQADAYTRADRESIPTGELTAVEGTPMDFRTAKPVGQDIEADYEALIFGMGYDHNWVISGSGYRKAAAMYCEQTGIAMEVYTDLPGMQFYTGNFLTGAPGKDGVPYEKRQGACFETQYFPDAIHKDNFEGPVLRAGDVYETTTAYRFLWD